MPAAADLIVELRVDDITFGKGSAAQQHEWRLLCHELVEEGRFEGVATPTERGSAQVLVRPHEIEVALPRLVASVSRADLGPLVDEYVKICREMTKVGVSHARMEALDIAKRIAHDEAAELILSALRPLGPDHGTARRFFSLFVTLLYDTTRLSVRPHTLHY